MTIRNTLLRVATAAAVAALLTLALVSPGQPQGTVAIGGTALDANMISTGNAVAAQVCTTRVAKPYPGTRELEDRPCPRFTSND